MGGWRYSPSGLDDCKRRRIIHASFAQDAPVASSLSALPKSILRNLQESHLVRRLRLQFAGLSNFGGCEVEAPLLAAGAAPRYATRSSRCQGSHRMFSLLKDAALHPNYYRQKCGPLSLSSGIRVLTSSGPLAQSLEEVSAPWAEQCVAVCSLCLPWLAIA